MDEADIANEYMERDLALRIAAARGKRQAMGPEECGQCGEPIPMARRQLGLVVCIDCARDNERGARRPA